MTIDLTEVVERDDLAPGQRLHMIAELLAEGVFRRRADALRFGETPQHQERAPDGLESFETVLENAAVDRAVGSNAEYQASVIESFKNGEISAQDASRLIDGAMHSALSDISTAETLSNRWDVKLNAGLKGNANSAFDTVVSYGSFGLVDRVEAFKVNDYERGAGYGKSYFVGRLANEAAFAILTGPKGRLKLGKIGRVVDLGGSIVQTTRGVLDAEDCGLTWENAGQIFGGLIGIGSNRGTIKELAQDGESFLKRLESGAGPASGRGFAYNPAASVNPVQAYDVGTYNALKSRSLPYDNIAVHHAGQADQMEKLVTGYSRNNGPSIALPQLEHVAIPNLRGTPTLTPRQLLARDIVNLRKYPNAPNDRLQSLIDLNKQMYPRDFAR